MSTRAQLLCRTGPAAGASFRLGDVSRLGRDPGIEVYIPYQGLSRLHATITFASGTFWLEDAGSTNGTALNGRRIKKERLYNLDIISLGSNVDLVFLARSSEDSGQLPTVRGVVYARLVAQNGPEIGAIQEIPKGTLTIGRSAACNVVIESPAISKMHARFERTANQLVLTDLGSSNGSFINSVRIASSALADGDVVVFGAVREYRVDVQYGEITGTHQKTTTGVNRIVPEEKTIMEDMSAWRARYDGTDEQPAVEGSVAKGFRMALGGKSIPALEGTAKAPAVKDEVKPAGRAGGKPSDKTVVKPPPAPRPPEAKPAAPAPPASKPPEPPVAPRAPEPKSIPAQPMPQQAEPKPAQPPPVEAPKAVHQKTVEPQPTRDPASTSVEPRRAARTEPSVAAPMIRPAARTEPSVAAPFPPPAPAAAPDAVDGATTRFGDAEALAASGAPPPPVARELPPVTALVLTGDEETLTVVPGSHTLGRQDGCAIVVRKNKISRQHAVLEVAGAGATVKDLASGNGTYLNDERLGEGPVPLKEGDMLRFAETAFKVSLRR